MMIRFSSSVNGGIWPTGDSAFWAGIWTSLDFLWGWADKSAHAKLILATVAISNKNLERDIEPSDLPTE
jgi:hypothetical protein